MAHDFVGKEINLLFDDLVKKEADCQQNVKPRSDYDKIVSGVAEEFSGGNAKTKSRNKEIAEIKIKIGKLKRSLKKNRNIRIPQMTDEEIIDEIKAVKDKLTSAQYWALLKPMLENGNCASVAIQYKPLEVLCKWTGASYMGDATPLGIKTMRLFIIEVIVPDEDGEILYMITDKEGPDPIKNACEKIK